MSPSVKRFFHWLGAELGSMLPRSLRGGVHGARRGLGMDVDSAAISVSFDDGRARQSLGRFERTAGAASYGSPSERDELRALTASLDPARTPVTVRVSPELTLSRTVKLPAAAAENLREVLGFEMERLTPFKADDVYYRHEMRSEDRQRQEIEVGLSLVRKRAVDAAVDMLDGWQLEPADDPAGDGPPSGSDDDGPALELEFRSSRFRQRSWGSANVLLVAVNVALLGVAVGVPLLAQTRELERLEAEVDNARRRAAVAGRLDSELETLRSGTEFLAAHASARPSTVAIIEDLSALLPDSTWLFRLEVKGGGVRLQGTSGSASALIGILEDSPRFKDVRFNSPVVREGNSGKERFNLSARLEDISALPGGPGEATVALPDASPLPGPEMLDAPPIDPNEPSIGPVDLPDEPPPELQGLLDEEGMPLPFGEGLPEGELPPIPELVPGAPE